MRSKLAACCSGLLDVMLSAGQLLKKSGGALDKDLLRRRLMEKLNKRQMQAKIHVENYENDNNQAEEDEGDLF